MSELLVTGNLRPNPLKIVPNGLADVQQWIEYHEQGKVRLLFYYLGHTFVKMRYS